MSRARPLVPILPRVIDTLLLPQACGTSAAAGAGHGRSDWSAPTTDATTAVSTQALSVPKPGCVFWNSHCILAHSLSHAEAGKGSPFPLRVMLCYMGTE